MRRLSISEFLVTNKSWNIGRWLLDWFSLLVYPVLVVLRDPMANYYKVINRASFSHCFNATGHILSKVLSARRVERTTNEN